jgi:hypothetical protein
VSPHELATAVAPDSPGWARRKLVRQLVLSLAETLHRKGAGVRPASPTSSSLALFHEDKSPSFSINVDLGLFNCFSCKRSGNIIRLLKMLSVPDEVIESETKDIRDEIEANKARLKWKKYAEWVTIDPVPRELPSCRSRILQPYLYAPVAGGHYT